MSFEKDTESIAATNHPLSNTSGSKRWNETLESMTRVSLAACGGAAVGLAQQHRYDWSEAKITIPTHSRDDQTAVHRSTVKRQQRLQNAGVRNWTKNTFSHPASSRSQALLPIHPHQRSQLPRKWALSCMFFVLILETSRRTSPTSMILRHWKNDGTITDEVSCFAEAARWNGYSRHAAHPYEAFILAIGDFSIGGMLAGFSATFSHAKTGSGTLISFTNQGNRPFTTLWSIRTGFLLGLGAGFFQGVVDATTILLDALAPHAGDNEMSQSTTLHKKKPNAS
jgi:hypothetical protein